MQAILKETKSAQKDLNKAPQEVLRAYEIWARLIEEHGVMILREFKGYHDEKLHGDWLGYRSSRLNYKWRIIYQADTSGKIQIIKIFRIAAHDYRRKL